MFQFTAKAIKVKGKDGTEIGAWTDGIGVFSDHLWSTGFQLVEGKTYKITIEEIKK